MTLALIAIGLILALSLAVYLLARAWRSAVARESAARLDAEQATARADELRGKRDALSAEVAALRERVEVADRVATVATARAEIQEAPDASVAAYLAALAARRRAESGADPAAVASDLAGLARRHL